MSSNLRLAEDHKFSHPFRADRNGKPLRLSFSDSRQLEKVDKTERRNRRLVEKLTHGERQDDPIADLLYELDEVQEKIAEIVGKKLTAYPVFLDSMMLPYLRVKQDKLLRCLTNIS